MHKQTIIFRADGGPKIGMGHFIRTLALAEILNKDFNCIYATIRPSPSQLNEINKACHGKIVLPDDQSHFKLFLECLKGDEIVVLDNYYFSSDYQKEIKRKGCKLVCIDDLHDREFYADLVINHSIGIQELDYKTQDYTRFALGLKYALVRQVFRKAYSDKILSVIDTLFICFGGADPEDFTLSTLKIILKKYRFKRIVVVVGEMYSHYDRLLEVMKSVKAVEIHKSVISNKMARLMAESDIGIIPSSGTMIEAFHVGLPVISGYYMDNQEKASVNFDQAGLILSCGNILYDYEKKLTKILDSLSLERLNAVLSRQKELISRNSFVFIDIFKKI